MGIWARPNSFFFTIQLYLQLQHLHYLSNKMKDDQDKAQKRLLSEIYIATDYEYLSRLN